MKSNVIILLVLFVATVRCRLDFCEVEVKHCNGLKHVNCVKSANLDNSISLESQELILTQINQYRDRVALNASIVNMRKIHWSPIYAITSQHLQQKPHRNDVCITTGNEYHSEMLLSADTKYKNLTILSQTLIMKYSELMSNHYSNTIGCALSPEAIQPFSLVCIINVPKLHAPQSHATHGKVACQDCHAQWNQHCDQLYTRLCTTTVDVQEPLPSPVRLDNEKIKDPVPGEIDVGVFISDIIKIIRYIIAWWDVTLFIYLPTFVVFVSIFYCFAYCFAVCCLSKRRERAHVRALAKARRMEILVQKEMEKLDGSKAKENVYIELPDITNADPSSKVIQMEIHGNLKSAPKPPQKRAPPLILHHWELDKSADTVVKPESSIENDYIAILDMTNADVVVEPEIPVAYWPAPPPPLEEAVNSECLYENIRN